MVFNNMLMWGVSGITDEVVVTIEGRNVVKEYDGTTQSISNYVIKSISNTEYTAADFIFSGSASASGTNVGTYPMNLSASQFTNINGKFKNVRFVVTDGYIRISPKTVTVTAVAKSKVYDGKSSTDPALTATVTGLIGEDTITYSLSRISGQNAGEYTISPAGESTQGNYLVNYSTAKFTITPAAVTLTATSGTRTYTGSAQSLSGFTPSVSGLTFASTVKASASGTNVGTYEVTFSGVTVGTTKDTTGNYVVRSLVTGTLTINPAAMAITVNGNITTRTYNGSSQSVTGTVTATSTNSGFNSSKFSYSGTKTVSGTNAGSYSTALVRGSCSYSDTNYTVTFTLGTAIRLTINPADVTLTSNSGTYTYDGSSKSVSGFTCSVSGITFSGVSASASRTAAGSSSVTFSGVTVGTTKDTTGNYVVRSLVTGTLTINKRTVTVTVVGATSVSYTYDGSSHSITGYTASSDWSGYTEGSSGFTIGGTITVSRTEVGTSSQNITVTNNNTNITLRTSITNGTITINSIPYYSSVTVDLTGAQTAVFGVYQNGSMIAGPFQHSGRCYLSPGVYQVAGTNVTYTSFEITGYETNGYKYVPLAN